MVASGDLVIVKALAGGARGVLAYAAPTASGELAVPVLLAGGQRALMLVVAADAEDDLAFPVQLVGGKRALVKAVAGAPVICNSCDPALSNTFTVTLANLAGDFAIYNGAHTVVYHPEFAYCGFCVWKTVTGTTLGVFLIPQVCPAPVDASYRWRIEIVHLVGGCLLRMYGNNIGETYACDPTGNYAYAVGDCADIGCVDTDSCPASSASTGVVT